MPERAVRERAAMTGSASTATPRMYDLVVAGGLVVDGTGAPAGLGDVAIVGDSIVEVSRVPLSLVGREVVNATGRIVTPGFVDIHSHADLTLVVDPRAHSALLQGVTSLITGNCGYGAAHPDDTLAGVVANAPGCRASDVDIPRWGSFPEYLDVLTAAGVGVNVFPLVSHATLRLAAAGFAARAVTDAESANMGAMLREAMQAGAVGFSTGLEYAPGSYATADELGVLSKEAGRYDGLYATHCRSRTQHVVSAAQEAVAVAVDGGCRLQLSHFVPRPAWPHRDGHERALDACRAAAVQVRFDVFPFRYGPTLLAVMLPGWTRTDGWETTRRALMKPELRERVLADLDPRFRALVQSPAAADMYLVCDGADGLLTSRTFDDLWPGPDRLAAMLDLLAAAGPDYREVGVLEPWATAAELDQALTAEDYFVMGDGITSGLDGPLAGRSFSLSDWGWAPAALSQFVRDRALVALPDMIRRMTQAPAAQAGLHDRGSLRRGAKADVVVLDLAALGASTDPARPGVPPSGICDVIVNGTLAVAGGVPTGAVAGHVGLAR